LINYNKVYELTNKLEILYIEDDIHFMKETVDAFEDIFAKVDIAIDGERGLLTYNEYYEKNKRYYDIVITDINMPNLDGIELIQKIYKQNESQPIIVISAYNNSDTLLKLVNIGIEQFLMKPLEYDKVLNTLYNSAKKINESIDEVETEIVILSDNYIFNIVTNVLSKNNENIKLTKKELLLLNLFIKNKTKISTLEEIYYLLWSDQPELASQELLKPILSRFRKKIPENIIENIYGLGYRLIL